MIATARGVTGLLRSIIDDDDDDDDDEDSSDEEEKDQASSPDEEEQSICICNGKIKDSCCRYAPSSSSPPSLSL